ncbi:hypothetical protein FRC00_002695 [Tulasnella sp. 408]|nr:hypothetical protein FRC00_002695 [Tulasnella sp. 408]
MLYRVPRAILQQSEIFGSILQNYEASGSLYVNGITTQEMDAFLEVSDAREVTGDDHFTLEQWLDALATADRLGIPRIRSYVTKKAQGALNCLDPFDCIDIATKYRVYEWLVQPYVRICERPESLSPAEMLRLALERASAVCRVREKLFAEKYQSTKYWIANKWPGNSSRHNSSSSEPPWEEMEKAILAEQAAKGHSLVRRETVLSRPNFPSPGVEPPVYTVPQGTPHPKYSQTDLREMKVGSSLYQLPTRYFERPDLLGETPSGKGSSSQSDDLLMLPHDVTVYDWNTFLDIVTARARRYILRRIETNFSSQNPIDLLEAAEIAGAPDSPWLQGLYKTLSERKDSLSPEDLGRIGKKASTEVLKLRDQYMWSSGQKGRRDVL